MMFLLTMAFANPVIYTVATLEVRDPRSGDWVSSLGVGEEKRTISTTDEALRVPSEPGADPVPLQLGEALPASTHLVTRLARVTLRSERTRETGPREIRIFEDSDLVLEQWGVLEHYGAVLYDVHGTFKVVYKRFEALVEGTRFYVEGDPAGVGSVAVSRGRVRVRSLQGEVVLRRNELTVLHTGAPPASQRWVPPDAAGWRLWLHGDRNTGRSTRTVERAGSPRLQLAAGFAWRRGIGEGLAAGNALQTEIFARRQVLGPLSVVGGLGLTTSGSVGYFPVRLGAEARFGPFVVGASALAGIGLEQSYPGDAPSVLMEPGFSGTLGLALPLSRRLQLGVWLGGGYLYTPQIEAGAALAAGF